MRLPLLFTMVAISCITRIRPSLSLLVGLCSCKSCNSNLYVDHESVGFSSAWSMVTQKYQREMNPKSISIQIIQFSQLYKNDVLLNANYDQNANNCWLNDNVL